MNGIIFANVSASAAVLLVLLLRGLFKEKLFAKVFVMLWLLIIIRLLLPFELYSPLSVFAPEKEPAFSEVNQPVFVGNLPGGKEYLSESEQNFSSGIPEEKTKISSENAFAFIWALGGISVFGFFAARHFYSVKRILKDSEPYDVPKIYKTGKTRFYKSKNLASPLSFGILHPVIVIPEETEETELHFVLLHEQTHIKDRDAVLKILALFALSFNWFNPLVWFMVRIFERDIERYCDERVLKKIGAEKALFYANTILDFAERESLSLNYFSAASLCERVTSIMKTKHKKQNIFVSALVLGAVLLTITACGTLPEAEEKEPVKTENLSEILDNMQKDSGELIDYNGNASTLNFVWPCSETVITSKMNEERNHNGIDIGQNYGSEIYAAADGTVYIASEFSPEYGLTVTIDHEQNFATLYANCSEIYVKKGDKVKAGELIARTGATGSSSCCGLHFEIHKEKTYLDPEDIIFLKRNEKTTTEIPGIPEEMMGYIYTEGEPPPNNYVFEIFEFPEYLEIEKIVVKGFSFSEEASINVICIPSNEIKISAGYGDELREAGFFVANKTGKTVFISTEREISEVSESFDLRIYADFDEVSVEIENLDYSVFEGEEPHITTESHINKSSNPETDVNFVWPTEGGYICAKMWSYKGHTGIDIMPETGINGEIFAAADGTVVKVKRSNTGYGYHMIIDHGNGVQTCYAHCSDMYVKQGQEVKAGEPIGKVGSTGNSTGTHLHFEIRINGEYVDPEKYLPIPDSN